MAYIGGQPDYVTSQPQGSFAVQGNPFKKNRNEWSVGLCDCCDDLGQCK